jgi:phosphoribosylanthranilate isomerase
MLKQIKICGITDKPTLDACIGVGVGFVGFNFVPQSPRYIPIGDAVNLASTMPKSTAKVALIVDETDAMIDMIITHLQPDYLQLHGTENIERLIAIKQKFNVKIIKAVGVGNHNDIENAKIYFEYADIMLFDSKPCMPNSLTGGHGQKFDWSLLHCVDMLDKPFMLAGGLNYHNLIQAKAQSNATYFDICSGVEYAKGQKSVTLINELKNLSVHF